MSSKTTLQNLQLTMQSLQVTMQSCHFKKNDPIKEPTAFKYNTILIVCDQMINFKNVPENILRIMPGYQAFKSLGIQFDNIYNKV